MFADCLAQVSNKLTADVEGKSGSLFGYSLGEMDFRLVICKIS